MATLLHNMKSLSLPRWLPAAAVGLFVLALQNILIFWPHYVGSASFLNDFTRIIYPMSAFWITLVQHGVFPEWTSFQTMGMPFVLTMQSGVFYPPLWLFAIFKIPYTLHMAAIVQVLHVLWGAIGCWLYLRLLGRSMGAALFAAIAFQFFGGFYSNSEHSDIIRAFSFIPWLFWGVQLMPDQNKLLGRNWFTPLIVMLFVTGAYQGNLVAHMFVLGMFWAMSWAHLHGQKKKPGRLVATLHIQIVALLLLGLALSAVYLLPTLALKSWLARDSVWTGQTANWPLSYWNTLIMPSNADGLFILPSMLSAFVTVPVFCLLFLISRDFCKQNWLWICITVFAFAMASGTHLFVYPWLVKFFPLLGASRFPSSDYRGLMCFGLILLASGLLDDYVKGKIPAKLSGRAALCLGLLLFFGLTNFLVHILSSQAAVDLVNFLKSGNLLAMTMLSVLALTTANIISAELLEWPVVIILSSLVFLTLHRFRQQPVKIWLLLIILQMASGLYFVNRLALYWRSEIASDAFYQEVDRESPKSVMAVINHPPATRPACHDMNLFNGSWRGYVLGDYMCQTQDSKTRPREVVKANAAIDSYMRQTWQSRLIEAEQLTECNAEVMVKANSAAQIHSLSYGLQQVDYQVNASADFCFVENELLFPGWTGRIVDSQQLITPQAYCAALRSWCLPKGEYQFSAQYRAPWLREGAIISLLVLVFYIGLCVYCLRRRCQK